MKSKVVKLTSTGRIEESDMGTAIFEGSDGLERAMDTRNYLAGDHVVFTETHPGYVVIRNDDRFYGLIITANAGTDTQHYIAYLYLSNEADWDGDTYCSSRSYKTFKGAAKKVRQYLDY